jgi:hypothetical protein
MSRDALREVLNSPFHGELIGIGEERDLKVEATQGVRKVRRVVDGIGEGLLKIGSVTDDEGTPVFRLGESRNRYGSEEAPYDKHHQA